jgi:hypothetical protein
MQTRPCPSVITAGEICDPGWADSSRDGMMGPEGSALMQVSSVGRGVGQHCRRPAWPGSAWNQAAWSDPPRPDSRQPDPHRAAWPGPDPRRPDSHQTDPRRPDSHQTDPRRPDWHRPDWHGRRVLASVCLPTVMIFSSLLLLSACGHAGQASDAGKQCGTSRSAANVPIAIEIERGYVACGTAMTVEKNYAQAIDDGKAPGEGGGGPVPVNGWICQGFPTPVVLKTGQASKCTKGGAEILATLPTTSS